MTLARFILIETSHAGNVGGAARAMKTMGFDDLVLVKPRDERVLGREETIQRASGATDVLAKARVVQTLDEALVGITHTCATAMIARDFGPLTSAPRPYFSQWEDGAKSLPDMAFLFGSERFGMKNEDVYRCHASLSIPTHPSYGSLNLASAVQVMAYEWRQTLLRTGQNWRVEDDIDAKIKMSSEGTGREEALADAEQVSGTLAHWQQALSHVGYLDPQAPKKLMPRLNAMFNRAQLTQREVHILRGIAKAMLQTTTRDRASGP